MRILYIAQNIPTPHKSTNAVIYKIATECSRFARITFLHMVERVPFFLRHNRKYRHLTGLSDFSWLGHYVIVREYTRIPLKGFAFALLNRVPGRLNVDKFDLCHAHYILPDGYIAYLIKKKHGIPYVVSIRSSDMKNIHGRLCDFKRAKKVIDNAERVVCLNRGQMKYIKRVFGVEGVMIPHGIDKEDLL